MSAFDIIAMKPTSKWPTLASAQPIWSKLKEIVFSKEVAVRGSRERCTPLICSQRLQIRARRTGALADRSVCRAEARECIPAGVVGGLFACRRIYEAYGFSVTHFGPVRAMTRLFGGPLGCPVCKRSALITPRLAPLVRLGPES